MFHKIEDDECKAEYKVEVIEDKELSELEKLMDANYMKFHESLLTFIDNVYDVDVNSTDFTEAEINESILKIDSVKTLFDFIIKCFDNRFNFGIYSIGLERYCRFIADFVIHYACRRIISVGSGHGMLEKIYHIVDPILRLKYSSTFDWVCIDPEPLNFSPFTDDMTKPYIEPKYATVDEMIYKEPECVNNEYILLNWCLPDESNYDYDAILKLNPKGFITLIAIDGHGPGVAGGINFIEFLKNQKIEQKYYLVREIPIKLLPIIKMSSECHLQWWERSNTNSLEDVQYENFDFDVFREAHNDSFWNKVMKIVKHEFAILTEQQNTNMDKFNKNELTEEELSECEFTTCGTFIDDTTNKIIPIYDEEIMKHELTEELITEQREFEKKFKTYLLGYLMDHDPFH